LTAGNSDGRQFLRPCQNFSRIGV